MSEPVNYQQAPLKSLVNYGVKRSNAINGYAYYTVKPAFVVEVLPMGDIVLMAEGEEPVVLQKELDDGLWFRVPDEECNKETWYVNMMLLRKADLTKKLIIMKAAVIAFGQHK